MHTHTTSTSRLGPLPSRTEPTLSSPLMSEFLGANERWFNTRIILPEQIKASHQTQIRIANQLAASLHYMLTNLNKPLTIATVSAMAGLSPSRFFQVFKNSTGYTPLNWFTRARMQWAGKLLADSDLLIKEIAGRVGYDDQYYFSRCFKSVHGMSPSEYRTLKGHQRPPLVAAPPATDSAQPDA